MLTLAVQRYKKLIMTIPPYLKSGNRVAIVAPAGYITPEQITHAIEVLTSWGLEVVLGKNLFSKHFTFSGTDEQRATDFQQAIDNIHINAVFCARGGYGVMRIIDKINWVEFVKNPKWVVGYSDITALHSCINNVLQIASIHGPMPVNFEKLKDEQNSLLYLRKALFGEIIKYKFPNTNNKLSQIVSGILKGGNLSLLYALRGTLFDFISNGSILFIEDAGEYMYHIDRMIQNFRLGNKFSRLKGLIVGSFTEIKENDQQFGLLLKDIINKSVKDEKMPVVFDFPAGHIVPNYPLIFGKNATIIIDKNFVELVQNQCS